MFNKWKKQHPGEIAPEEMYDEFVFIEKGCFHGFILLACGNIAPKCRRQRFYPTFVARYHGLSRKGNQLLAHYGLTQKMSTFDDMEKDMIKEHKKKLR
jgi:hypothetical protein